MRSVTQDQHPPEIPSNLSPDTFNSHFLSVSDILQKHTTQYTSSDKLKEYCKTKIPEHKSFKIPPIAVHEVSKYISQISTKKSAGIDGISGFILKLSLPFTIETLTYIYNLCINSGTFPSDLKVAKVIPLPKTKDLTNTNNYRPISILSIISKPLEKHIHSHLFTYLNELELLHPLQSGFRPGHSCHTALANMTNKWLIGVNNSMMTGAVFLDLRKAFDLIDHNILLDKLFLYLKNTDTVSFLRSYLQDRKQYVYVHGTLSTPGILKAGVPQGSVLGPLLFCLYINDLPIHITCPDVACDMFADDTTLHTQGKEKRQIETNLQNSLNDVSKWCQENSMLIHPDKTKSMLIGTRQKLQLSPLTLNLTIESISIQQVSKHRLLGVELDDQLSWKAHTDKVCKKLSQNLFLLSKLKHYVGIVARKLFFKSHIKAHVDYASTVWDKCSEVHFKRVNSLYRRAAKLILPDPSLTTDEKMKKLGILPLDKQLAFNKAVFMYKIVRRKAPAYLCNTFEHSQARYENSKSTLKVIRPRIDLTKTSLSYSGASLWNSLPRCLKDKRSLNAFKTSMHKHIILNQCNS